MSTIDVRCGDCRAVLVAMEPDSFDAVVCDPPYHLTSIVKRFGAANAVPAQYGTDGAFARASRGFLGKRWDGGDVAFRPETWTEVCRVLKPGGFLLAFGGTRTYHRMVCAIEDAGFEIRDQVGWMYGTGFPKSKSVSLFIDKRLGYPDRGHRIATASRVHPDGTVEPNGDNLPAYQARSVEARQWEGWGTAIKPAWEPIMMARKPLVGTIAANILAYGTGGLNVHACTVAVPGERGRFPANVIHDGSDDVLDAFTAFDEKPSRGTGDSIASARFFYSAKAGPDDRVIHCAICNANRPAHERAAHGHGRPDQTHITSHPTTKPIDLMRWLCRLVTPPGGHVLDPFAGSGTTGMACMAEGFRATLIDQDPASVRDIKYRLAHVAGDDLPLMAAAEAAWPTLL